MRWRQTTATWGQDVGCVTVGLLMKLEGACEYKRRRKHLQTVSWQWFMRVEPGRLRLGPIRGLSGWRHPNQASCTWRILTTLSIDSQPTLHYLPSADCCLLCTLQIVQWMHIDSFSHFIAYTFLWQTPWLDWAGNSHTVVARGRNATGLPHPGGTKDP